MKLVIFILALLVYVSLQKCPPKEKVADIQIDQINQPHNQEDDDETRQRNLGFYDMFNFSFTKSDLKILSVLKQFLFGYNLGYGFNHFIVWLFNLFSGNPYTIVTEITTNLRTYDYIIVGGGTSGSVIANRLTEDPRLEVLVLEAGGEESKFSNTPLFNPLLQQSDLVENIENEPQGRAARGMKNARLQSKAGHCVGGSSSRNGMIYDRGDPLDYDIWDKKYGASGWSFKDVFSYFIRSEGIQSERQTIFDEGYHSKYGPLTVEGLHNFSVIGTTIMEGIRQLGLPIGDYNGIKHDTFNYAATTIRDGERCSTGKAFLAPASQRDTVDIVTRAVVTKLLFNSASNNTVTGVEYKRDEIKYKVYAKREVIIAAGAYQTPKILMLSGIGPEKHLKKHGIQVRVNLPGVGKNLQHHAETVLFYTINNKTIQLNQGEQINRQAVSYQLNRTGLFSSPGYSILGHQRSKYAIDERPDIGLHLIDSIIGSPASHPFYGLLYDFGKEVVDKYLIPYVNQDGFQIQVINYRTESRGYVKLKSNMPSDPPVINGKMFNVDSDLEKLVEACKLADSIVQSSHVQSILNPAAYPNTLPGCSIFDTNSDGFYRCLSQTITFNSFQPCCTARMGSIKDEDTVVDSELKVRGVNNLRIADASVMPEITTGDITAPTIMIGEKASDLIKGTKMKPIIPPFVEELIVPTAPIIKINDSSSLIPQTEEEEVVQSSNMTIDWNDFDFSAGDDEEDAEVGVDQFNDTSNQTNSRDTLEANSKLIWKPLPDDLDEFDEIDLLDQGSSLAS